MSLVYQLQENGVTEHKHQHLLDVTRTIVLRMNLPAHFWGDVILTSCFHIVKLYDWRQTVLDPSTSKESRVPFGFSLFYAW